VDVARAPHNRDIDAVQAACPILSSQIGPLAVVLGAAAFADDGLHTAAARPAAAQRDD